MGATICSSDQGDAHTFAYTNLDENTNYDIYCATNDATPVLSNLLEVKTPGLLVSSTTSVVPTSLIAGTTNNVNVTFTTVNEIPIDGIIYITFPSGFDVNSRNIAVSSSDIDGNFTVAIDSGNNQRVLGRTERRVYSAHLRGPHQKGGG